MRKYKPAEAYKAEFQKINRKFLAKIGFSAISIGSLALAFWIGSK